MERLSYEKNKGFIWRYTTDTAPREPSNVMHYDNAMVITLLSKGRGSIFVENARTEITQGDIVIVSPNEFHRTSFEGFPEHERTSIYVFPVFSEITGIDRDRLFGIFFDRELGKGNVIPSRIAEEFGIHKIFDSMKYPHDADDELLLQCKVIELLIVLKRAIPLAKKTPVPTKESKTATEVIGYINDHLSEELSTSKIADALFLNKSYLCREFKKSTGATINQYVTKKRIYSALNLMASGISCTEACYRSGFGNYSSFYKYCKRYTDFAPIDKKIKKID